MRDLSDAKILISEVKAGAEEGKKKTTSWDPWQKAFQSPAGEPKAAIVVDTPNAERGWGYYGWGSNWSPNESIRQAQNDYRTLAEKASKAKAHLRSAKTGLDQVMTQEGNKAYATQNIEKASRVIDLVEQRAVASQVQLADWESALTPSVPKGPNIRIGQSPVHVRLRFGVPLSLTTARPNSFFYMETTSLTENEVTLHVERLEYSQSVSDR
jgi:hypothetical protein